MRVTGGFKADIRNVYHSERLASGFPNFGGSESLDDCSATPMRSMECWSVINLSSQTTDENTSKYAHEFRMLLARY